MAPILYKSDGSPPARAVMMLADIINIKLDMRNLNPVLREQDTEEFTKKNPMRTIPLLEDDNFYLADSHAITIYLLQKYGKPEHASLYPDDLKKRSVVTQRLFFDCAILFPRLRAIMAPVIRGKLGGLTNNMIKNVEDAYRTLDAYLTEYEYVAANEMTLADICIVTTVSALDGLHSIDPKRFPKTKRWLEKMAAKDFCKQINEPGNNILVTALKSGMEMHRATVKSHI